VEECDDGNTDDADGCANDCTLPRCGDGIVQAGEECDDGNLSNHDSCLNTCLTAICGDGYVNRDATGLEECDDGNLDNTDGCLDTCEAATCGDGFVRAAVEACDDGNLNDNDGCTAMCRLPSCGDGIVETGVEECDDGNLDNTDGCLSTCLLPSCGDGFLQAGSEECDDGNLVDGDWCSSTCTRECIYGEAQGMDSGHCYMAFAEPLPWLTAEQACELIGAHLVEIGSAAENTFVTGLVDPISTDAWIGLTDQWSEGTFVWILGPNEVLAQTHDGWATGEPSGNGDCGLLTASASTWSDEGCADSHAYVCEYEWE
jgi:cysteine-rich repeat protein